MKNKRVIIISFAILVFVCMVGITYYKNMPIVSINNNVLHGEMVANGVGFSVDSSKDLSINYRSTVKDGNLIIRLTDENWNTIKEFEAGTSSQEKISLEKGNYYMRVESDYFKGKYKVQVYN